MFQVRVLTPILEGAEPPSYEEIVERVKAEMPAQDGFTLGGGKIKVTPYGFLRLDMAYDDSNIVTDKGNLLIWVPGEGAGNDDDERFIAIATAITLT